MVDTLFKNMGLLDSVEGVLRSGVQVLVRDKIIAEVSEGAIDAGKARVIDLGGRTLMPGLIDCHVHFCMPPSGMSATVSFLPSMMAARAADHMHGMLMRGFTTARDACGADLGHKQAVEMGLFTGPRLFVCGLAISQTGGHGDSRQRADLSDSCKCMRGTGRIADGVTEVRRAVREELRLGADQIKIHASGGTGSPGDPIDQLQYSTEEIDAAVDEARRSHTYVMAHTYTDAAIRRCAEAGVRTIEHGNMLEQETAHLMAKCGTFLVPTLVVNHSLAKRGRIPGDTTPVPGGDDPVPTTPFQLEKNAYVLTAGTRSLEVAKVAGVKMAFGTDLGRSQQYQCEEFLIRAEVLSPAEIIRSATVVGAEVVRMEGKIGVIAEGAFADLLVVDGNPLDDLGLFQGQGQHLSAIMKEGTFYKDTLDQ